MAKFRIDLNRHPLELIQSARYKIGKDRKSPLLSWVRKNQPESILEIGVFNGHFASRMLREANIYSKNVHYTGIDLFKDLQTDQNYLSEASLWPDSKNNVLALLEREFPKADVNLLQGFSDEVLPNLKEFKFDLIFIDGGHAYETVKKDWILCKDLLTENGVIFFDDYTNKNGTNSGFGVNQLVDEVDTSNYIVKRYFNRDFFKHDYGWLTTRLVKVQKKKE